MGQMLVLAEMKDYTEERISEHQLQPYYNWW